MKKISICICILLSILLSGCDSNTSDTPPKDLNTNEIATDERGSFINDNKNSFKPYEIEITADEITLYNDPGYDAEPIDVIRNKGIYIVVDESEDIYQGTLIHWGKIKNPEGWIILDNLNNKFGDTDDIADYIDEDKNNSDNTMSSPNVNNYQQETKPSFQSYTIKIQNNKVSVYSEPDGYLGKQWLYDITDRRTITIVEEKIIKKPGGIFTWGRLESVGWVNLEIANYIEEEQQTINTDDSIPPSDKTENTQPDIQIPSRTEKPTIKDGTYIPNVPFDNIYGCGSEHSITIEGITFHWYDRYEKRNKNNTEVLSYMDIVSFPLEFTRHTKTDGGFRINDIRVKVSDGVSASLWWSFYDKKEGYFLGQHPFSNKYLMGNYKGRLGNNNVYIDYGTTYAELFPTI